ncbi:MAG: VOC family protein, partial [Longimicrobiales bacterium]
MSDEHGERPEGHRLPDETHVGTVRLKVSDLDRSLEFYERLLGMRVIDRDADGARLGADGNDATLLELRPGADPRVPRRGRLGLYHFAVLLPDRPALGRLLSHLVHEGVHPGAADHLVSESLYLQDPDDLGIELYRDRPRSEWTVRGREGTVRGGEATVRGREVVMATDALDAAGIIAAADGAEWTGMPAGTTIGHIHLHVAALAAARAFYSDALGLDVVVSSYPGALFMSAGGYHHHLGVNTWDGAHAQAPAENEPQLLSWELVLPSVNDVAA